MWDSIEIFYLLEGLSISLCMKNVRRGLAEWRASKMSKFLLLWRQCSFRRNLNRWRHHPKIQSKQWLFRNAFKALGSYVDWSRNGSYRRNFFFMEIRVLFWFHNFIICTCCWTLALSVFNILNYSLFGRFMLLQQYQLSKFESSNC